MSKAPTLAPRTSDARQPESENWIALGVLTRPHGVRGEVRLQPFNPDSELLLEVDEVKLRLPSGEERILPFERVRRAQDAFLVKLPEVDDRNAAETLRGAEVLVRRSDFPPLEEGEFYVCDVLGAAVIGPAGEIGRVENFVTYPSVEAFVVRSKDGSRFEIPLLEQFVERIDVGAKSLFVTAEGAERHFE